MESIFETKEQFLEMRNHFRKWYNAEENRKKLSHYHFALYALLRGKDWRKCFATNTSDSNLDWIQYFINKSTNLFLDPFGEQVTMDSIEKLRNLGIPKWE